MAGVPISDKSDESDRSDRSDAELDVVAGLGRPTCPTCLTCPTCPIRYRPLSDKVPPTIGLGTALSHEVPPSLHKSGDATKRSASCNSPFAELQQSKCLVATQLKTTTEQIIILYANNICIVCYLLLSLRSE